MAKAKKASSDEKLDILIGLVGSLVTALNSNKQEKEPVAGEEVVVEEKKRRGRPSKKAPVQTPTVKAGRPNRFESMAEFHLHKEDTVKFDKKVWKGKKPAERGVRASNRIEIKCSECPKMCSVWPEEIAFDTPYRCNNCMKRRGGGRN